MKKSIKKIIALSIVSALVLSFAACGSPDSGGGGGNGGTPVGGNFMRGDNDFENDGIDRDFDFSDYDYIAQKDFEADTGELVDHIYEFECMELRGTDYGHACLAKQFHFDASFGGNICMKNYNACTLVLTVECDKNVKVPVEIRASNQIAGEYVGADKTLKDYLAITTSNNKVKRRVDLSEVYFPTEGTPAGNNNGFFNMTTLSFELNLGAGTNEIMFKTGVPPVNMDYVNIKTSATLGENTTPQKYIGEGLGEVEISGATKKRVGSISFNCLHEANNQGKSGFALPNLTDGLASGMYYYGEGGNADDVFMTVFGKEYSVKNTYVPESKPTGTSLGHVIEKTGADFYDANKWATYNDAGSYGNGTAKPTVVNKTDEATFSHLSITKAARFELFHVKGNNNKFYHLFDNPSNWADGEASGLYGQEFMYEMEFDASAPFMLELFGPSVSKPEWLTGSRYGITLYFDGSNVSVGLDGQTKVQATAGIEDGDEEPINVTDGSKHTISVCVVRKSLTDGEVRIFIDGHKVMFEQTPDYMNGRVVDGTMLRTDAGGFGQRFGVVPMKAEGSDTYGEVNIYGLEITKVVKPDESDN